MSVFAELPEFTLIVRSIAKLLLSFQFLFKISHHFYKQCSAKQSGAINGFLSLYLHSIEVSVFAFNLYWSFSKASILLMSKRWESITIYNVFSPVLSGRKWKVNGTFVLDHAAAQLVWALPHGVKLKRSWGHLVTQWQASPSSLWGL